MDSGNSSIREDALSLFEKFKAMSVSRPAEKEESAPSWEIVPAPVRALSPAVVKDKGEVAVKRAALSRRYDSWAKAKEAQTLLVVSIKLSERPMPKEEISSLVDHVLLNMDLDRGSVDKVANFIRSRFANGSAVEKENMNAVLDDLAGRNICRKE